MGKTSWPYSRIIKTKTDYQQKTATERQGDNYEKKPTIKKRERDRRDRRLVMYIKKEREREKIQKEKEKLE